MPQTLPPRNYGIDLLKCMAIWGVIVIHTCTYAADVRSFHWLSTVFWGSLTRGSVPLFLLCSGALFLGSEKPLSVKRLFTRNIPRILVAMVFWAMSYKVFHLLAGGEFSLPGLIQGAKEVLFFQQEFHLYYLQIILLVYLFLPITGLVVRHATRRELEYLLLLWFAFGILYPTVAPFWPFRLLGMMIPQFKINMVYAAIGYGVLGHYLRTYPIKKNWAAVMAGAGFLLVFGGTVLLSARDGGLNPFFFEGMSVGVCLLAAGLFSLCVGARPPKAPRVARLVDFLSKGSFCVFLCHVFFLTLLPRVGLSAELLPPLLGVPLMACVTLLASLCVYALLSRIPWVKQWLV